MTTHSKACPGCGETFEYYTYDFDYSGNANMRRAIDSMLERLACDACVIREREEDAMKRKCQRSAQAREISYSRGWMPQDARSATFKSSTSSLETRTESIRQAFVWGREWTPKQEKPWAFIMGPAGTGKSYFARCLLNRCMSIGKTAYEVEADQLQRWGRNWEDDERKVRELLCADAVLIEEIGIPRWTYTGVKCLRRVIDSCWRNHKPLFITSNLTPEECWKDWQAACANDNLSTYTSMRDRMRAFTRLLFDGESLRKGVNPEQGQMAI